MKPLLSDGGIAKLRRNSPRTLAGSDPDDADTAFSIDPYASKPPYTMASQPCA
ncbi:MAG: hypothetical protein RIB49_01170 [Rhodospirillales bacterium]